MPVALPVVKPLVRPVPFLLLVDVVGHPIRGFLLLECLLGLLTLLDFELLDELLAVLAVLEELAVVRLDECRDAGLPIPFVDDVDLAVLLQLLPRDEDLLVAWLLVLFLRLWLGFL